MTEGPERTRIVSLLPAATETLYAVGAGSQLVGASHECDHPEAAARLPRVSRPRIDPAGPSAEIDAQVKAAARKREGLYELDAALIARLAPDLVFTQVQCEVCAVTPEDLQPVLEALPRRPKVVALDGQSLEGVLGDIRTVATAVGRAEEGKLVLLRLWRLIKEIRRRVEGRDRPRVGMIDWLDPVMFAGNWVPELARIAGGQYTLVAEGKPSRWGSWDELEEYEADVVVAAPCGRGVEETRAEFDAILRRYARGDLPALDAGRVFAAEGHHLFNRPGPRLPYSAAVLARAFHPDLPPLPASLEAALVPVRDGPNPH